MAYKTTSLTAYEYKPPNTIAKELPLIIDDWTLAFHLGFRGKTLWYLLHNEKNNYRVFTIPKKSGGLRTIHDPIPLLQRFGKRLRATLLLPLVEQLGTHVSSYRKNIGALDAAAKHVHPCPVCEQYEKPHTCNMEWDTAGKLITKNKETCVPCGPIPKHPCARLGTKLKIDLKDFFPSTKRSWIRKYFQQVVGYNHYASSLIATLLTTNFKHKTGRVTRGVPIGLVTSGDICNLIADWRLDQQLIKALPGWTYTRYADDLYFSQPNRLTRGQVNTTLKTIRAIVKESGYRVNEKKVSVQTAKKRQRFLGATLNRKLNVPRKDFDRMRVLLHHCLNEGFEASLSIMKIDSVPALVSHIQGRLVFFENVSKSRTARLRFMFEEAKRRHPVPNVFEFISDKEITACPPPKPSSPSPNQPEAEEADTSLPTAPRMLVIP